MKLYPPVHPWRGLRGTDPAGDGAFGSGRTRNGVACTHLGLDILVVPGDDILSPIDGVVSRVGLAYADSPLNSIHITSTDGLYEVKILYASCGKWKKPVKAGEFIGVAQDVAAWYAGRGVRGMKPHIHLEVRALLDPTPYLPPDPQEAA